MIINKPLFHIIKHNDINYIEINEVKNKKNNKNINKKMVEEIDEDEIIENYPYEFWEDEINNDNKKDKELKYIISDAEPQPEPGLKIEVNTKKKNIEIKNKERNDENVIDFDEESIFITNDKTEENNVNVNIKDNELNEKKDINFENINKINLNFKTENKYLKLSDILEGEQNKVDNKNINKKIIKDKGNDNMINKEIIRNENGNNNILIQNENKKKDSNKENIFSYSLDQEEIMDILNLNKEKKNLEVNEKNTEKINDEEISKIFLNQVSAKKLIHDLYEKEMKFKNAYAEYYTKLSETMNNNYFKEMLQNSNSNTLSKENINQQSKTNIDYLIHQQTNTRNDINIFCLNNNNSSNNYLNFNNNESKSQTFEIVNNQNLILNNISNLNNKNSESPPFNGQNQNINIKHSAYEEYKISKLAKNSIEKDKNNMNNDYIRHPTIILSIRKFLNEYNISVQNRTLMELSKNPSLNYESYIDILNDLNYIDQSKLPQIYFINISIYRQIWNFLVNIKNDVQAINGEEFILESNLLLIFLLLLNGFFNNTKIIDELEIELNWINFENYEKLILKYGYIMANFKELIDIRKNNILSKSNSNLILINKTKKNFDSEIKSKEPDDILSEYFNSYINQISNNKKSNIKNDSENITKEKNIYNYSDNKIHENKNSKQKIINHNSVNNKLYAFKPRNNSNMKKYDIHRDINKVMKKNYSLNSLQANKSKDSNPLKTNAVDIIISKDELKKSKHLKRSKIKNKILKNNSIHYNELYNLSQNKEDIIDKSKNTTPNSNILTKKSSKKNFLSNIIIKGKSGDYSIKVKQNRTDLKKLFKNNEYKDGTINERLEKIKKQRNISKPKGGKVQINYEEYTNLNKFKENEQNKKIKYQFRKHTPPKKNNVIYNFKIEEKEYILEHNPEENIEIEIMQLIQKNNIIGINAKSILEIIKNNQKNNYSEIK